MKREKFKSKPTGRHQFSMPEDLHKHRMFSLSLSFLVSESLDLDLSPSQSLSTLNLWISFFSSIAFYLIKFYSSRARNTLSAVVIFDEISENVKEIFLTGATSKLGRGSQGFDHYLTVRRNGGLNQMRTGLQESSKY